MRAMRSGAAPSSSCAHTPDSECATTTAPVMRSATMNCAHTCSRVYRGVNRVDRGRQAGDALRHHELRPPEARTHVSGFEAEGLRVYRDRQAVRFATLIEPKQRAHYCSNARTPVLGMACACWTSPLWNLVSKKDEQQPRAVGLSDNPAGGVRARWSGSRRSPAPGAGPGRATTPSPARGRAAWGCTP